MAGMDVLTDKQNLALVSFAFLQADCGNAEYRKELLSLGQELNVASDINLNGFREECRSEDGNLETDGHMCSSHSVYLLEIEPFVGLPRPGAAVVQQVAAELMEIADQLEHDVVTRATQNLSRNLQKFPCNEWKDHLSSEVDKAIRQGIILNDLAQEKVMVALTLTLVKGVCEQAPRLMRSLFDTMLEYIGHRRAR